MSSEALRQHFGQIAPHYDELRLPDDVLTPQVETLVEAGDLWGRKVLDIGCGTGRMLSSLVRRYQIQGWGVDASAAMLDVARAQVPPTVTLQQATAEALPFSEAFFERVYLTMVVHLLNRPVVLREIWRVLKPSGRVTIMTADWASFETYWLALLFPSYQQIEQGRFPRQEALEKELASAGFLLASCTPLSIPLTFSKEAAMHYIRERPSSTFALLDEEEYREGIERAERDLPEVVTTVQEHLFITAEKPA
ncbi:MAG: methyltransferase domain-containing protein [Ktedonobacterales bacterium]